MASGDPTKLPFPIPPSGPVVFAPQPPTHVPSSSTDIINTFTNMKIVMSFAKYLREKYCGLWTSTRDTCLDSQKKFIDKYYLPHLLAQTLKTVPSRETIYNDLSAFVKSRGSNISSEFDQWKQTMEGRAVLLTKGGKRNTRRRKHVLRKKQRSKSKKQKY